MEAMKYSPYRIAMCLCQPGIVLSFFWKNEYWFEEGVLYAILFTVTVVVLLDMPRGVVRWSVAGCYAVAFTAVFCRGWVVSHTAISPAWIMEAILMSFGGCMVVAVIVALVSGWHSFRMSFVRPIGGRDPSAVRAATNTCKETIPSGVPIVRGSRGVRKPRGQRGRLLRRIGVGLLPRPGQLAVVAVLKGSVEDAFDQRVARRARCRAR
jgi:hypothetical protein